MNYLKNGAFLLTFVLSLIVSPHLMAVGETENLLTKFKPELRRMYNGCLMLSIGVQNADCEMVGFAVDSLNQNDEFEPLPLNLGKLKVEFVDTTNVIPINDCFDFTDVYGLQWRDENCESPYTLPPSQMREFPIGKSDCNTLKLRLRANSAAVYKTKFRNKCQLFVIGEPGSRINIEIESGDTIPVVQVNSYLYIASWDAGVNRKDHTITISNESDFPSTIYLVTD